MFGFIFRLNDFYDFFGRKYVMKELGRENHENVFASISFPSIRARYWNTCVEILNLLN